MTRVERDLSCKKDTAPEAFIKNRETRKTRILVFANTPTNMLGNLGFCNTLQLICEAFFAARQSHFHKCNTLQPICSILSGFAIPPNPFACFHVAKGTPKSRSRWWFKRPVRERSPALGRQIQVLISPGGGKEEGNDNCFPTSDLRWTTSLRIDY